MIVDIGAHLRKLVLAGLPLLGAACEIPDGRLGPARPPGALAFAPVGACQPRMIIDGAPPAGARTIAIGFDRDDPRVGDLYQACVTAGDYCPRLCKEVLRAGKVLITALGTGVAGPHRCELACDGSGQPVVTVAYTTFSEGVPGRRPAGFAGACATEPGTSLAEYFAACAALEGASIAAFCRLAAELEHHGAPAALVGRARKAAGEEARHFRVTAGLARTFGAGRVRCPRVRTGSPRDLAAIALENVTEGCLNETYSAAVALWQAARAGDAGVRAALAGIAEDELAHAQLAWEVHRWVAAGLGAAAAQELEQARAEAGRSLLAGCARPVDPVLVARAGLPDARAATWLAGHLNAAV
jgi:hypothetical protein